MFGREILENLNREATVYSSISKREWTSSGIRIIITPKMRRAARKRAAAERRAIRNPAIRKLRARRAVLEKRLKELRGAVALLRGECLDCAMGTHSCCHDDG